MHVAADLTPDLPKEFVMEYPMKNNIPYDEVENGALILLLLRESKNWEALCGRYSYADPAQLMSNTTTMTLLNKLFNMRDLGLISFEDEETGEGKPTKEVGIRMALGAERNHVLLLVARRGIALVVAGAAVGIGVALGVTRFLASILYDVRANDLTTIAGVAVLLGLVALAACWIPARRAMRTDPMVALRYE